MKTHLLASAALFAASALTAQVDPRLSSHTYVREDIFAALDDDLIRFERGEKKLEQLLVERPQERPALLAWQGGALLYRASLAHKAGKQDEFLRLFEKATATFEEAVKGAKGDMSVWVAMGGSSLVFADRLPEPYRTATWNRAHDSYQLLYRRQARAVPMLPLHLKGELLSGLAQTAQRTGHGEQLTEYLDRLLREMPGTPYASKAATWKENPALAAKSSIACQTCHDAGRLELRLAELAKEPVQK